MNVGRCTGDEGFVGQTSQLKFYPEFNWNSSWQSRTKGHVRSGTRSTTRAKVFWIHCVQGLRDRQKVNLYNQDERRQVSRLWFPTYL